MDDSARSVFDHFGISTLYGTQQDYQSVEEHYRDLIVKAGWIESGHMADGSSVYCHHDIQSVDFVVQLRAVNDPRGIIPASIPITVLESYKTLYSVTIVHYPYQNILCKQIYDVE